MSELDPDFLAQYMRERDWAAAHGITRRTAARYREHGLPYMFFGGWIWIPRVEGDEWIASRVKRRNVRQRHKTTAPQKEIAA